MPRPKHPITEALGLDDEGKVRSLKSRFPLIPFSKLKPTTERDYLVKGIVPRDGLIPVWGPPKCGKSFWVSDLVLHVALGWEYRGHKVVQGAVVYCASEGSVGFRKRAEALRRQ